MDDYEDEFGPPTKEDLDWYIHHVVARGYPPVQKGEPVMDGQTSIYDVLR